MILKEIQIDFASPVPVYEQIKRSIKHAIAKTLLPKHHPLPSIRELAAFLKVNPNTVARAYRELVQEKIAGGRAGKGFWIEGNDRIEQEKMSLIQSEFLKFMESAIDMGFSSHDIKKLVDDFFRGEP